MAVLQPNIYRKKRVAELLSGEELHIVAFSAVLEGRSFCLDAGTDGLDKFLGKFFIAEAPTNILDFGPVPSKGSIAIHILASPLV